MGIQLADVFQFAQLSISCIRRRVTVVKTIVQGEGDETSKGLFNSKAFKLKRVMPIQNPEKFSVNRRI
jgi:hypothetical protein